VKHVVSWLSDFWVAARSTRGIVTGALLMAMTVAALEQTVVSTAMPTIIAKLKGMNYYAWVLPSYLLAITVTTPIYGKLADMIGRKKVLLFGLAVFAAGSMFSGLAQSMPVLIAMRVVQGIGAGAVMPVVLTMVGDLYTLEERAKVQGLFSAVWGINSLAGPAIGGYLTEEFSWRSVFFVAVPFAVAAGWILVAKVKEGAIAKAEEARPIDWAGSGLLTVGITLLLLAVLTGGGSQGRTIAMLVASALVLVVFAWHERRVADPVLPIDLFRIPNIAASMLGSFMVGGITFCIDVFVPLFVQGVKGGSAEDAGAAITPLFLTWACSVAVAARVVVRLGFRRTAVIGSCVISFGLSALAAGAIWPEASRPLFLVGMVVIGLGMGPTSLSYLLDVQNTVSRDRRGSITGASMFTRTIGGALSIGILGAVLGRSLARFLAARSLDVDVAAALRPESHHTLSPEHLTAVQEALGGSLQVVFLQMVVMALICLLCAFGLRGGQAVSHADAGMMPEHEAEREPEQQDESMGLPLAVEH
jgi:MFS family permease